MASAQQEFDPGTPDHVRADFMRTSGTHSRRRKRERKRKDHVCKDRSAWLSMENTGICHVELKGSRAYLAVVKPDLSGHQLVRIHHCPFCGVALGKRKKKQLRDAPTGRHARLLREQ